MSLFRKHTTFLIHVINGTRRRGSAVPAVPFYLKIVQITFQQLPETAVQRQHQLEGQPGHRIYCDYHEKPFVESTKTLPES